MKANETIFRIKDKTMWKIGFVGFLVGAFCYGWNKPRD